jgi:CheY-like chemotaxis protein
VRDNGERQKTGRGARVEDGRPRGPRVLVAEDERDVAELIRHHLTKDGYDAVLARTGIEALERARREKPDLILLDCNDFVTRR